jgi:hypothetical protein
MSKTLTPRAGGIIAVLTVAMSLAIAVSRASAYNGPYCYGVYLDVYSSCGPVNETHIRRAIGHGRDYTFVKISGDGIGHTASCYSDGCTADTYYLPKDVNGSGVIQNAGDPCNCGGGTYYGWLYP